jgi:hypothetical protein
MPRPLLGPINQYGTGGMSVTYPNPSAPAEANQVRPKPRRGAKAARRRRT